MANESEIKYLTPIAVETQRKKYCRFKKLGIKYIDYLFRKSSRVAGRSSIRMSSMRSLRFRSSCPRFMKCIKIMLPR